MHQQYSRYASTRVTGERRIPTAAREEVYYRRPAMKMTVSPRRTSPVDYSEIAVPTTFKLPIAYSRLPSDRYSVGRTMAEKQNRYKPAGHQAQYQSTGTRKSPNPVHVQDRPFEYSRYKGSSSRDRNSFPSVTCKPFTEKQSQYNYGSQSSYSRSSNTRRPVERPR